MMNLAGERSSGNPLAVLHDENNENGHEIIKTNCLATTGCMTFV